jgi:beta-fructofuranosidase
LWGWIPERRDEAAMREAGWSGMMSLPRVMNLDTDGTLRLRVLPETSALRAGVVPSEESRAGVLKTLRKANGEVLCGGASQFTMSYGETPLLEAEYVADRHVVTVDGKEIQLLPGDLPTLHAFVDGSVIELIVGERIGYTKRFYYTDKAAPDIMVHAIGGGVRMTAWKIAPISANRLTSPALGA